MSQMPNATETTTPATNSAKMIRRRRVAPWVPYMSIAASRLTFTPAMVSSVGDTRCRGANLAWGAGLCGECARVAQ
jgi:hypothetical protein